jgi:hypothetical protein
VSGPWFVGHEALTATNGGASPDPVTTGDASWTWDLEFNPVSSSLYARVALDFFSNIGGGSGWAGGGVVQYRTRSIGGGDTVHHVGQSSQDGFADFIWDTNVDSVTFGFLVEGDNFCEGRINMEVWI